jgi:hypothetical protein
LLSTSPSSAEFQPYTLKSQFIICEITEFDINIQVTLLYWFTTVTLRHSISRVQLIDDRFNQGPVQQIRPTLKGASQLLSKKKKKKKGASQLANQNFSFW